MMKTFGGALLIMTVVAIVLKFIAIGTVIARLDIEGFSLTVPLILGLLSLMAYSYYKNTKEDYKTVKSVLLVLISFVISFLVVLFVVMSQLRGFHG